ncbi:MAG: hypothetical protein ACXVP0_01815 [Bacteroidia bacterium]
MTLRVYTAIVWSLFIWLFSEVHAQSAEFRQIDQGFAKNTTFQAIGEATLKKDPVLKSLADLSSRQGKK